MNSNNNNQNINKEELQQIINDYYQYMSNNQMEMSISAIECYIEEKKGKMITLTESLLREFGFLETSLRLTQSLSVSEDIIQRYVNSNRGIFWQLAENRVRTFAYDIPKIYV